VQYFVVIARQRSFSQAAALVGVAQPALSQQMKRLEKELGVVLIDRSSRPIALTEAGAAFHARAERMLAEASLAVDDMREFAGAGRGQLVVGSLPALASLWLPAVLGRFQSLHPGVRIVVREKNTEELARLVGLGEVDLAILHAVPGLRAGDASYRGIVMERLFEEELVVIVAPDHRLAAETHVALAALRTERFVLLAKGSGLAHTVMTAIAADGFRADVSTECTSMPTLRALVSAGLGVSIIPRLPAEAPGPAVAVVTLRPALPRHATAVACRGDSRPSAPTEALLGVIREHVARSLAGGP